MSSFTWRRLRQVESPRKAGRTACGEGFFNLLSYRNPHPDRSGAPFNKGAQYFIQPKITNYPRSIDCNRSIFLKFLIPLKKTQYLSIHEKKKSQIFYGQIFYMQKWYYSIFWKRFHFLKNFFEIFLDFFWKLTPGKSSKGRHLKIYHFVC